jgi:hypothetical protein
MMANLEKNLRSYQDPPDYWKTHLKNYLEALRGSEAVRGSLIKPEHLSESMT